MRETVFLKVWIRAVGLVSTFALASEQPDILVYLSDDHSQVDSSVYGNPSIPTPQLERLAGDGMKFTHAFVASPSCAPSRAALLTGLMPARNGAEANHTYPKPDAHSLILDLKKTGYEVAAFGKVAHGKEDRVSRYGFDHIGDGRSIPQVKREVEAYLRDRASNRPLCLFVGTTNPHVPWTSPSSFDPDAVELPPHHLDTPQTRVHRAAYYQEIHDLDAFVGDLRHLASEHMSENLLIVHSSDHGSQWPFGKWNLYDYGIRVPLIVSWAGKIEPGSRSQAMVSWIDVLPTLIDVAGGAIPQGLDGESFMEVLLGRVDQHRDAIFTTHTGDGIKNIFPIRSIRTRHWKLIHNLRPDFAHTNHSDLDRKPFAGAYWTEWAELAKESAAAQVIVERYYQRPEWELFHVSQDPWEQTNRVAQPDQAERVAALKGRLTAWMDEQGDQEWVHRKGRLLEDRSSWHPDGFKPAGEERPPLESGETR